MKTLADIENRIKLRKEKAKTELKNIVEQLKELGALKIIVFGSYISNRFSSSSDLDILVIMPDYKSSKEWIDTIYTKVERKISVDFFIFIKTDYQKNQNKNFFLKNILNKGKIIYEKKF
ncbi:MAG: nucleotidyltransferase domain-containing protein [Candidatus Aenigmatarchaeota archaeon]